MIAMSKSPRGIKKKKNLKRRIEASKGALQGGEGPAELSPHDCYEQKHKAMSIKLGEGSSGLSNPNCWPWLWIVINENKASERALQVEEFGLLSLSLD